MNKWRLGISSADNAPETAPILLKGSIYSNLETASSLGFDAIEVHMLDTEKIDYSRINLVCEKYNVKIAMLVTGRLNTVRHLSLLDDDNKVAEQAREGLKHYIDIAARLGCGIVIGWAKGNVPAGKDRSLYIDRLAEHLSVLDEYGHNCNVPINLEVINRYETNIFNTSRETVDFLDKYSLKNCFVHLDTFHMNIEEVNIPDAIRYAGPRLGYFHIADNDRRYIGHGALDFKNIFGILKEISYKKYISLECLPFPNSIAAAQNSKSYIDRLYEELNE